MDLSKTSFNVKFDSDTNFNPFLQVNKNEGNIY